MYSARGFDQMSAFQVEVCAEWLACNEKKDLRVGGILLQKTSLASVLHFFCCFLPRTPCKHMRVMEWFMPLLVTGQNCFQINMFPFISLPPPLFFGLETGCCYFLSPHLQIRDIKYRLLRVRYLPRFGIPAVPLVM